jgi:lipoprotein-anchoring transpeptidase ErfK/SrfK
LVRGPFHAVVSKGRFTVDLFLQREGLPRVWVKRVRCGLGKDGSTPVGMWKVGRDYIDGHVILGGKLEHPTWNPPPSSDLRGPIQYGQKGYALGEKGLWIGLVGIDENTRGKRDYGIHSTSDPTSIGKEQSLGCIRLADDDIELVYSLLYEVYSSVQTKP